MKGVQCYELFGGIALKIHTFSFFHFSRVNDLLSNDDEIFTVKLTNVVTLDLFYLKPYWLSLSSSVFLYN